MLAKWAGVDNMVKTKIKQNLLPVLGAQVDTCKWLLDTGLLLVSQIQQAKASITAMCRQHQPGIQQPLSLQRLLQ